MEWVDMASWGLGELERSAENAPGGDCSVDLKLGGGFGYSGEKEGEQQHKQKVPTVGSSKRPRGLVGGAAVSCMVDGCTSDLTNSKDYHRRHKVCELHSKSPMAFVGGQQQRFCQQCSRFHLLVEFDEVKRSCRKRLDGHNRRRRKPQFDPLSTFPSSFQGWNTLHPGWSAPFFSTTHLPGWSTPFYPSGFKEGKQLPFHGSSMTISGGRTLEMPIINQPIPHGISFSESSGKIFGDGLSQVLDSDCALSLLSSNTQTSGIDIGQIVPTNHLQMGQLLPEGLHQCGEVCRLSSDKGSLGGLSNPATNGDRVDGNININCHGYFHGSAEGHPFHVLPFSWQ